jgi:hypothetical protein
MGSIAAIFAAICPAFLTFALAEVQHNFSSPSAPNICITVPADTPNTHSRYEITVNRDVSSFGDVPLCMEFERCGPCLKSPRIILAIDASGSMCLESTGCRGATKNDSANMRVAGANALADSISNRCKECEIGVIVFSGVGGDPDGTRSVTHGVEPLPLNFPDNLDRIHHVIDSAKCPNLPLGKVRRIEKQEIRGATFTGFVLDSAIKLVDRDYDSLSKYHMQRHIILFSDGDWHTPPINYIVSAYNSNFPGRPFPIVHGVVLSDTAAHLAAGLPLYGCLTCDRSDTVPVDFSFLQIATKISVPPGIYIHATSPESIVSAFKEMFWAPVETTCICLGAVSLISASTREERKAEFKPDPSIEGRYLVNTSPFSLVFGVNEFYAEIVRPGCCSNPRLIITDTIIVNRSTSQGVFSQSVIKFKPRMPKEQLFNLQGRFLKKASFGTHFNGTIEYRGVYIVKYPEGRIARRIAVHK